MAHDTDELRAEIEERRQGITDTVEQIENRVMPGRIMARRRDRMRRRMTDWKDAVFGNDEPQYGGGWAAPSGNPYARADGVEHGGAAVPGTNAQEGVLGRAGEATTHAVEHAPEMIRRQTRGNPLAAGVIALGAGWLVGSVLPRTGEERRMARRLQPTLAGTAAAVASKGRTLAADLREPIRNAADEVVQTGHDAADDLRERTRGDAGGE